MEEPAPGYRREYAAGARRSAVLAAVVVLAGGQAALLILAAVPGFRTALWGLNAWTYLGTLPFAGVLAATVAVTVLLLRPPPYPRGRLVLASCAAGAAPVLWMLRDTTHLLGDGRLWISTVAEVLVFHPHEPLALALAAGAVADLRGAAPEVVARRLEAAQVVLGAVAVALMVLAAGRLGRDRTARWLALGLLAGSGALQLGFGYVEAYPLVWVWVLGFLACGLHALDPGTRGPGAVAGAALCAGLATATHLEGALLAVGLAALLIAARARPRVWVMASATFALPAVLIPGLLSRLLPSGVFGGGDAVGDSALLVWRSLAPPDPGWLLRQVNQWALVAPAALLAVPGLALVRAAGSPDRRRALWLAAGALPFAAVWIVLDTGRSRGAAADWDFVAAAAPLFAAAVAACLVDLASRSGAVRRGLTATIALGVFGGFSFVAVQSSETAAVARFTDLIVQAPPRARALGYETLALHARDAGRFDAAADFYAEALAAEPGNLRLIRVRAGVLSWAGRHDEAASLYREAARAEPDHPGVWHNLGLELERTGASAAATDAFRREIANRPDAVESMNRLASILSRDDATREEAYGWVEASLRAAPQQPRADELRRVLETRRPAPR